ncbi:hypothetical protein U9M48_040446 [Paspalum notatum var. saurae]|uniref:Uncharacterized protein n=1 Tax=Paspalum notatum var. saurae TaxID=547442 RepID=A0AAQ3UQN1_PASNO
MSIYELIDSLPRRRSCGGMQVDSWSRICKIRRCPISRSSPLYPQFHALISVMFWPIKDYSPKTMDSEASSIWGMLAVERPLLLSWYVKLNFDATKARETGEIAMVIGIQSLIADKTNFSALRISVIDEQQHFGVVQRGMFNSKFSLDQYQLEFGISQQYYKLQMWNNEGAIPNPFVQTAQWSSESGECIQDI